MPDTKTTQYSDEDLAVVRPLYAPIWNEAMASVAEFQEVSGFSQEATVALVKMMNCRHRLIMESAALETTAPGLAEQLDQEMRNNPEGGGT